MSTIILDLSKSNNIENDLKNFCNDFLFKTEMFSHCQCCKQPKEINQDEICDNCYAEANCTG